MLADQREIDFTVVKSIFRDGDVFALRQEIDELRRMLNDEKKRGTKSSSLSGEVSVTLKLSKY